MPVPGVTLRQPIPVSVVSDGKTFSAYSADMGSTASSHNRVEAVRAPLPRLQALSSGATSGLGSVRRRAALVADGSAVAGTLDHGAGIGLDFPAVAASDGAAPGDLAVATPYAEEACTGPWLFNPRRGLTLGQGRRGRNQHSEYKTETSNDG